ncbi:peptidylprolyl isomerase [Plectonema cf. radiosum LEGE 06105]|uniref:peptidylprolyl isomerase n=1 Tax=Plectonema cf. radiosum LEGE 06105 TaxID=945769 RepID=A0A8J7F4Q7_9CYAN|nr:peptidylprolyl isomerase [Plectonema radiosum]MBE9214188.1 peptidylprolyl isomerase [Plectonema cf. radiosum LEGE 06105]
MSVVYAIKPEEILHEIKLSCQIPTVVENILTRKIIINAAQEVGIKAEAEELQQAADNVRLMSQLKSADATWTWLQKHRLSLDDFEELVYVTVISSKLTEYLFAQKVEAVFVENQLDYTQVVLYEVVFDDEDLAMEMFYAIAEGEITFPEVAHEYIQDTSLRRTGGYKGILNRTDLKPEISAAVFAATPPQIIKPIITSEGVNLIFVEEIIQPELNEMLRSKILNNLFSEWLKEQMEQLEFEIIR